MRDSRGKFPQERSGSFGTGRWPHTSVHPAVSPELAYGLIGHATKIDMGAETVPARSWI